jgi:hypothetical protein
MGGVGVGWEDHPHPSLPFLSRHLLYTPLTLPTMDRLGYTVLAVALLGITTTALPIPSSYISDPFPDLKGIQAHPSNGYPAPHRPVQGTCGVCISMSPQVH